MMATSFWYKMLTGLSIHRHVSLRIPCRPACIYLQSKKFVQVSKKMRTLIKLSGRCGRTTISDNNNVRAGPRTLEYGGGHRMARHDVSGVSLKGESMRGGIPLSFRGPGGSPPGKIWEIVVPEKRF